MRYLIIAVVVVALALLAGTYAVVITPSQEAEERLVLDLRKLEEEVAVLSETARNADALRGEQERVRRAAAEARQRQGWLGALNAITEDDSVVIRGWVPKDAYDAVQPSLARGFSKVSVRSQRDLGTQIEFEATFQPKAP